MNMLTADELAIQLVHILEHWSKGYSLFSAEQKDYYKIQSVESNGNIVRIIADSGMVSPSDEWEFQILCSGATMIQPEDTDIPVPEVPELESSEKVETIDETQPQGVREKLARKVRPPKVTPPTKSHDKTPKRPANNDPTQTPRGRASVRRQIRQNKKHPERFEGKSTFLDKAIIAERNDIIPMVDKIDPIVESKIIQGLMEDGDPDGKLAQISEVIRNIWSTRFIEKHIGIAKTRDDELKVFHSAGEILNEFKDWGAKICWIERIRKSGFVVYKVCADSAPSQIYMERKKNADRDLILSADHANIIPKIFGDL